MPKYGRSLHYIHDINCPYMAISCSVNSKPFVPVLDNRVSGRVKAGHCTPCGAYLLSVPPVVLAPFMAIYGDLCICQSLSLLCPYIETLDDIRISVSVCLCCVPFTRCQITLVTVCMSLFLCSFWPMSQLIPSDMPKYGVACICQSLSLVASSYPFFAHESDDSK